MNRRHFLAQGGLAATAAAATTAGPGLRAAGKAIAAIEPALRGKAEHCIFIWLGGGACHIDTWDPKRRGDPVAKKPGSYYDAIETAVPGVKVCQHLSRCARVLDRFTLVRTVHHDVIDEHAAATNRLHTGRPTSGTILYPSVGSIVAKQRGAVAEGVPPYIVMGYPNVTRGPGFLGARHGYLYLTDTASGPRGLTLPPDVDAARQGRRAALLGELREGFSRRAGAGGEVADYDDALAESLRLAGGDFMKAFRLGDEPDGLRADYGGEFGQRCLLARRLVQTGVRFIEVSHNLNFINGTGWDTHNQGQLNQHILIEELDRALASLVVDLEKQGLLERTLVVVATEFGRPPGFDGGGGRGHHSKAFSVVLAGGGLQHGRALGTTDELGVDPVERPVSVPDLHASIHAALGIDPAGELFDGDRPVPVTDRGKPLVELFPV